MKRSNYLNIFIIAITMMLIATFVLPVSSARAQDPTPTPAPAATEVQTPAPPTTEQILLKILEDKKLFVKFVMADSPQDGGWNFAHYRGVKKVMELCDPNTLVENGWNFKCSAKGFELDVQVVTDVHYDETHIFSVIESLVRNGAEVIFGTWFDTRFVMESLAKQYPWTLFVHCSGYPSVRSNGTNFTTYFSRMELSGDYPLGFLAGLLGLSKIGVDGTIQIPEPMRGLFAFGKGMMDGRMIAGLDPAVVDIRALWIGFWLHTTYEKESALALIAAGYDIRQLADTWTASQTAAEEGKYAFAYGSSPLGAFPDAEKWVVGTNEWDWGRFYKEQINAIIHKSWETQDYWEPDTDLVLNRSLIVKLAGDESKADSIISQVLKLEADIKAGRVNPFCGLIEGYGMTTSGLQDVFVPKGMCLSDGDLLNMNWYLKNVKGDFSEPYPQSISLELKPASVQ